MMWEHSLEKNSLNSSTFWVNSLNSVSYFKESSLNSDKIVRAKSSAGRVFLGSFKSTESFETPAKILDRIGFRSSFTSSN